MLNKKGILIKTEYSFSIFHKSKLFLLKKYFYEKNY